MWDTLEGGAKKAPPPPKKIYGEKNRGAGRAWSLLSDEMGRLLGKAAQQGGDFLQLLPARTSGVAENSAAIGTKASSAYHT